MKRKSLYQFFAFIYILLSAVSAQAATVSVSPSSFNVPRGSSSIRTVSYLFSDPTSTTTHLVSSSGAFSAAGETIEMNSRPITAAMQNGSGQAAETITLSSGVIEKALLRGANKVIYSRTFTNSCTSVMANIVFIITSEAGASFEIKKINLYFENKRPEMTVPKNAVIKAYADIRFVGSGLLQGRWEADGMVLDSVSRHLAYGADATIQTPEAPPIPTYEAGSHTVRFVITNPVTTMTMPSIIYYVTPAESLKERPDTLKLNSPADEAVVEYGALKFDWERPARAALFQVKFFDSSDSAAVFSAYTKDASYSLPESVVRDKFSAGRRYSWGVKAFDAEEKPVAESEARAFTFKKTDSLAPGEIIAALDEAKFSEGLLKELQERHGLKALSVFPLQSLGLRAIVFFTTEKDVFKAVNALKKDRRLVLVQPNYVMRTMSDPLRNMQHANDLIKADEIHAVYRGRGVKVAVVDTGVDAGHDDLRDRIAFSGNYVRNEAYRAEVHGTAVAGIIAAGINGTGIEGIAPEAEVLALRACRQVSRERPEGECFSDSIASALDAALVKGANIVNMSFGASDYDGLLARLIDKGAEKGVLFVAPSENGRNAKDLRFPASYSPVISVGGLDEKLNPYPNAGIAKKTSVCAPAVNIIATVPGNRYNFMSGTSLSSAFISGLLALSLERGGLIDRRKLPPFKGDICNWAEEMVNIPLCPPK